MSRFEKQHDLPLLLTRLRRVARSYETDTRYALEDLAHRLEEADAEYHRAYDSLQTARALALPPKDEHLMAAVKAYHVARATLQTLRGEGQRAFARYWWVFLPMHGKGPRQKKPRHQRRWRGKLKQASPMRALTVGQRGPLRRRLRRLRVTARFTPRRDDDDTGDGDGRRRQAAGISRRPVFAFPAPDAYLIAAG